MPLKASLSLPIPLIAGLLVIFCAGYVVYYRYLHPLAKYPGPFAASLTKFWKAYQYWTQAFHHNMLDIHQTYGPIVRIGPNDLMFNSAEAIGPIYKSGGRVMPKSQFYDAFTAIQPNVFGTRDETLHSLRRRQLAHGFSVASLRNIESTFDIHIGHVLDRVKEATDSGTVLDLKQALGFYGYDVTGKLAFDREFNTQTLQDPALLPPLNDHFLLGNMFGSVANLLPYIKTCTSWIPWVRSLHESRATLAKTASESVYHALKNHKNEAPTKTLLTSLINAKDPDTGARLSEVEIRSEAFAFLVAGSHTTGSSLTILFYFLLVNPTILSRIVAELDNHLPAQGEEIYDFSGLESKLPYTLACIREGFRMAPISAHLVPRLVVSPEGLRIGDQTFPQGTNCSIVNHCLHHNPVIWGPDHDTFDPSRFVPGSTRYDSANANLLLHFGQGHRQCVGRNVALISIWKIVTTLFKNYEIELVDKQEPLIMLNFGVTEKKGPLLVNVKRRRT